MRRTWIAAALAAGLCVAACGDNAFVSGVTSESSNVSGSWSYSASDVAGGGLSCNITGVTINLTQTQSTFSGTVIGGHLRCLQSTTVVIDNPLANDVIANGRVTGSSVSFDIGTPDVHHSGTMNGNSITGQLTIRADTTGVPLTGRYTMAR
ncbi:MAG: hypothetical protein ACRENP_29620 [Longimicrobiales bacterium]